MANDVFIEFDELDSILRSVKELARLNYANDGFVKQIISDIFFEIDRNLIAFEEKYRFQVIQGELQEAERL